MSNFFRDLFRRKKSDLIPATKAVETIPLEEVQNEPGPLPEVHLNPPQLFIGTAQSVGLQRDHNEDTLFALQAIYADGNHDLPFGIFIIADGMGGHLNGEVASAAAARALSEYLITHFYVSFLSGQPSTEQGSIYEILENGVTEAQNAVLQSAPGGGTTLTAALMIGDQVTLSHVGDSRAYFVQPDGQMTVMTHDHSLVRRLQDLGQIDEKEAISHPQRNVLYRALGQREPFRPDIETHTLPASSYLMICSDGLWGSVPDDEMYRIVQTAPSPRDACQRLVDAANEAGGPDNISVILVKYVS